MAEAALTEAPLKRKLEDASGASESKKPRDCVSPDIAAAKAALLSQEDATVMDGNLAERNDNGSGKDDTTVIDGNLAQSNENGSGISAPKLPVSISTGSEGPLGDGEANASEIAGCLLKQDGNSSRNRDLQLSAGASGSTSAGFEDSEALGEGEVLEAIVEQDDDDVRGDEDDANEEVSEIDTENNSEDEDESEGAGSDEDEDEDDSDDISDDENDEEEMPTTTSSSLQAEAARKGKAIDEGKGKEKMVDVKGKGIMLEDKGKGKAIAEDEATPGSDEDDAGYLSEDPLEEVDLNNILPTRTRRRSSSTHYDFVDQGNDEDDDDDSDA